MKNKFDITAMLIKHNKSRIMMSKTKKTLTTVICLTSQFFLRFKKNILIKQGFLLSCHHCNLRRFYFGIVS